MDYNQNLFRYAQQFKNTEKLTANYGNQVSGSNFEHFPEFQQYQNYVQKNLLSEHRTMLKASSIDEQVYNTYVDIPRRTASIQVSREWSSNARKRYEGYAIYLRSGRYPSQNQIYQRRQSSSGILQLDDKFKPQ